MSEAQDYKTTLAEWLEKQTVFTCQYLGQYHGWKSASSGGDSRIKLSQTIPIDGKSRTVYYNVHFAWTSQPTMGSMFIDGIKGFALNPEDNPKYATLRDAGMEAIKDSKVQITAPTSRSDGDWRGGGTTTTTTASSSSGSTSSGSGSGGGTSTKYVPPGRRNQQ